MKNQILGTTRSALMFLMFVPAQAQAQACPSSPPTPPPSPTEGGQHPTLLASYAKRPAWKVAGVDYAVGVPATTALTDWHLLSGSGITVNATARPPFVRVADQSNVVISGVDFSLHGGGAIFFVNSPNPTVTNSKFGGPNLAYLSGGSIIYALPGSPGLTVSYNTVDGGGAQGGSSLVSASGGGTTTLTYNWLKNFPQHVLELNTSAGSIGTYSLIYKYNLIEKGGTGAGNHLNYLQFGTNSNSSSIDVEYNTSYQTWQAAGGEGYQFGSWVPGLIRNVTVAYNVMIAAGSPTAMSYMVHGDGIQNAGIAHDNYIDPTSSYGWLYPGSFTGWTLYDNYNMKTGAIIPAS